jgi:hypothetical protein
MAIIVKHPFVSTVPDAADTSIVRPTNWNADHTVTGLGTAAELNAGVANGVATLDSGGKVPVSELPAAVLGALSYQGTWNASTNTPTLTSSVGTKGYYYVVSVAGNTDLNGITDWLVGDWAVYNGTAWQKIDNTDAVTSVNGLTGAVVLTTTNVAEGTNLYYTDARARAALSAGTGISYNNTTGVITNSSPSLGGDVVGPASATDNAVARYDTTTGKLLQNSTVLISDSGGVSGVTTLAASTSVTTPIVQATNSAGLALRNSAGTTQISMGGGGGDNVTIAVATNINGTNAQIDISPTGTGHVHIKPTGTGAVEIAPTNAGTMNNMVIGGTTPLAITGTTITATSFVGSGASLTNVVNSLAASTGISVSGATGAVTVTNTAPDQTVSIASGTGISATGTYPAFTVTNTAPDQTVSLTAGTGISTSGTYPNFTITNTAPSSGGTVTSVAATVPSFLSVSGSPITTSGTLALTYSGTALPIANGGTGETTRQAAMDALAGAVTSGQYLRGNGTDVVMSAIQAADVPTLNQNTTGSAATATTATNATNSAITNDDTTNATMYPVWVTANTGNLPLKTSSGDITFNPSTGLLNSKAIGASNGIIVNNMTIAASYTIPTGYGASSVGPVTVASGQSVTVPSGSRWVVL